MIFVTFHQAGCTFYTVSRPLRQTCRNCRANAVRFEIGFINYINSVFVTQIIPNRIARKVAGTYCVDVETFHYQNILNHGCIVNSPSCYRTRFYTINTLELNGLTIDKHTPTFQFEFTKSDITTFHFYSRTIIIDQRKYHFVKIRMFC